MIQAPKLQSVFDAKLFVEYVDDAIADHWAVAAEIDKPVLFPGSALQTRNVAFWKTKGAELQWRFQPHPRTELFAAYAYADTTGEQDRSQSDGSPHIAILDPRVPQHQLSLLGSQQLGYGFEASLAWYRQTSTIWLRGDSLKPYDRVDGRLAKHFGSGDLQASVELILQSFTAPYTEFEGNNTVDNRGFLRLKLDFL